MGSVLLLTTEVVLLSAGGAVDWAAVAGATAGAAAVGIAVAVDELEKSRIYKLN